MTIDVLPSGALATEALVQQVAGPSRGETLTLRGAFPQRRGDEPMDGLVTLRATVPATGGVLHAGVVGGVSLPLTITL